MTLQHPMCPHCHTPLCFGVDPDRIWWLACLKCEECWLFTTIIRELPSRASSDADTAA